jgi:hypothetical protein
MLQTRLTTGWLLKENKNKNNTLGGPGFGKIFVKYTLPGLCKPPEEKRNPLELNFSVENSSSK